MGDMGKIKEKKGTGENMSQHKFLVIRPWLDEKN